MLPTPITIVGRDPLRAVVIDPPHFLAPMEGVTDPLFRDCVLLLGGVGAACTEFVRVSSSPIPARVIRKYLGPLRRDVPVGVQLMAAGPRFVAETAASAERAGAAFVDLNFGCPAPVVFKKCAGSALLAHPEAIAAIVREAVSGTALPVTVKMRAGIADAARLSEPLLAAAEAGARLLTLHARLRCNTYSQPARWEWIADARAALRRAGFAVPLVGNGGVDTPADLARMRAETGCEGVMVGRGAIADPWIFAQAAGARAPGKDEAARFAIDYAARVRATGGERAGLARLKQLLRWFRAGGILDGRDDERRRILRMERYEEAIGWLEQSREPAALAG